MISRAWAKITGAKTIIGAALLLAGAVNDEVVHGIWGAGSPFADHVAQTFEWVGIVITTTGLGHKTQRKIKTWREGEPGQP